MLEFLQQQGVTVLHVVPGPSNVLAGQTGLFRTSGVTAEKMADLTEGETTESSSS